MSQPILAVFLFESALNKAVAALLLASGINDPAKQGDSEGLKTPRVEIKSVFGGWYGAVPNSPHVWVCQSGGIGTLAPGDKFPDLRDAKLLLKVVTRRGSDQDHDELVGMVRGVILTGRDAISSKMDYHTIAHLQELDSLPDFNQDQRAEVTGLTFEVRTRILFDTKTAQIFPN